MRTFKIFALLFWVVVSSEIIFSQENPANFPVSELSQRQLRFRAMEQRALELSERLSKMTGTEPIELFDRNESLEPIPLETNAQNSYDSLPGPMVDPLPLPVEEPVEQESVQFKSEVSRVVATTQQRKGDYYFMPVLGFSIASNLKVDYLGVQGSSIISAKDDLDGGWGNSVSLTAGRRWDNWLADLSLSYQYQKYDNPDLFDDISLTTLDSDGFEESILFSITGGYTIPLTERLSHNGAIGFGLGSKKNAINVIYSDGFSTEELPPMNQSSFIFAYDFSLGFEYMFVNNFSGYFGYKFLGMTKNKNFGTSYQHLIELGLGANF